MANNPSAKKRARQNIVRRTHNMGLRARMRTFVKRVTVAVESGDKEAAQSALHEATSMLDKTANKGLLHANNVARQKSRMNARVKAM